jgi:hypothetical protein
MRDLYYRCINDDCGHFFVAQLVIKHSIAPSRIPNPRVVLAVIATPATLPLPANDDVPALPGRSSPPQPANDDPGRDPAASDTVMTAPG